jgi:2-keto-3-deoxy-galactonokinase
MTTITFDTHKFVRKLKEAGFEEKQAEALTEAIQSISNESEIVTRRDLQIELAPIKADINLMKWMLGAILGLAIANFAKQFL